MRVKPSVPLAIAVFVVHVVVFIGIAGLLGGDYKSAFGDVPNARPWVYGLAGSAVFGILAATAFGWWRPILRDDRPVRGWLRWVPLLILAAILVVMDYRNVAAYDGDLMAWVVAGMILVGFSEELTFRGLVLVGMRGRFSEGHAWFGSTLLFGLLHAFNALVGSPLPLSLMQVVLAFVSGTSFYLTRRATGSILPAMVLHGLWDFTLFTQGAGHLNGLGGTIMLFVSISIFVAFVFSRRLAFAGAGTAVGR